MNNPHPRVAEEQAIQKAMGPKVTIKEEKVDIKIEPKDMIPNFIIFFNRLYNNMYPADTLQEIDNILSLRKLNCTIVRMLDGKRYYSFSEVCEDLTNKRYVEDHSPG